LLKVIIACTDILIHQVNSQPLIARMCRWFAYISPNEPCLLSDVLIRPANSLSKQVSEHFLPGLLPHGDDKNLHDSPDKMIRYRNALLNMDGLGVTFYTPCNSQYVKNVEGLRPATYKSARHPSSDINFQILCDNIETKCLLAHIRASSGGSVTETNCHPFVFGRHAFMHNGVVNNFQTIKIHLLHLLNSDVSENIHGVTDSEHAAALYITNLTKDGDKNSWQKKFTIEEMIRAMVITAIQIMEVQNRILGDKRYPNSLNFCATDGKKMVAIRFRNSTTGQPPSLYWSNTAGRSLNRKYPGHPDGPHLVNANAIMKEEDNIGKHTIISSEPTTYDEKEWKLVGRNCAFAVDEFGNEMEMPISYDESLNVDEPNWD
jgi:glutamine amidotransferase